MVIYMEATTTTKTLRVRDSIIGEYPNLRAASEAREALWDEILTGTHPTIGADDFEDYGHFIARTSIT